MISVKGAPEVVLPRCVGWTRDGRMLPLTDRDRREIDAEVDRLARQGLRVLAIAERRASRRRHLDEDRVDRLVLRGLLGLADTYRPTAAEAVRRLRSAGVNVVMLTGDHPSTAEAIGAELDLLDGGAVVTGSELDETDDETLDALVSKARSSPGSARHTRWPWSVRYDEPAESSRSPVTAPTTRRRSAWPTSASPSATKVRRPPAKPRT